MNPVSIIIVSVFSIPVFLLVVVGVYAICIKGILRLFKTIELDILKYKHERIRIKNDRATIKQTENRLKNKKDIEKYNVNKRYGTDNYVVKSLLTAAIAVIMFITASIILSKCFDLYISYDNIVLTFAGVLATFIVVTNYAQVSDIKREFSDKVDTINRRMKQQQRAITDNGGENQNSYRNQIRESGR